MLAYLFKLLSEVLKSWKILLWIIEMLEVFISIFLLCENKT